MSAAIAAQSDARAEEGEGDEERLDGEREGDVLANHRERPPGVADEPGQTRQVVGEQRHVGGLDGGIRAGAPHGDRRGWRASAGASLIPSPTIATRP
jgi:hypothetical protein